MRGEEEEEEKAPKMTVMDENLARASLTSGVHPPKAEAIDYPLVTFFGMREVPVRDFILFILSLSDTFFLSLSLSSSATMITTTKNDRRTSTCKVF